MSTPSGVSVGQGQGVPTEFLITHLRYAFGGLVQNTVAPQGTLCSYSATAGAVQPCTSGDTILAGFQAENVFDPAAGGLGANRQWAAGVYIDQPVGSNVTMIKQGTLFLTNVTGSVSQGHFLEPSTSVNGSVQDSSTTNNIKNGAIVCVQGNTVSGGPITVEVNLA